GFSARMSSAELLAGTTVTLAPRPDSRRRMLRLTPKSTATMCIQVSFWLPKPSFHTHGVSDQDDDWPEVTSLARSRSTRPCHARAFLFSASPSKTPSGEWAMTALG